VTERNEKTGAESASPLRYVTERFHQNVLRSELCNRIRANQTGVALDGVIKNKGTY
jgi:hypothetical protein